MGTVSSACEGCFGGSKGNPEPKSAPVPKENQPLIGGKVNTTNDGTVVSPSDRKPTNTDTAPTEKPSDDKIEYQPKKPCLDDFKIVKVIGRGSFGKVCLVQKKSNEKYYALKKLKKEEILKRGHIESAETEKKVLQKARHPFVLRLRYSFQTETALYLVMDFCQGGELFMRLKRRGRFNEETAKFYAAEVILALEYLHEKLNIIYRDLKPENILLDAKGHVKITDFGLSKAAKKGTSFCGTPEYLAPEILIGQGYDKCVDWWSLGCLIYEMLSGVPPFSSQSRAQLYQDILKAKPVIPHHFSEHAKNLISRLLVRNPKDRLGANGADEIKKHPFFENINWDELLQMKKNPPIIPDLTRMYDFFDRGALKEQPAETPTNNSKYKDDPRNKFPGYTYTQNEFGKESYATFSQMLAIKQE